MHWQVRLSLRFVHKGPIDNKPSLFQLKTVSVKDWAHNRRQASTWTNADPVHWRMYAELGGDELMDIFRPSCQNLDVGIVIKINYFTQ